MIRTLAFSAAIAALATPALALSCLRPDVVQTYKRAAEAEESYSVVIGTIRFDESKLPKSVGNDSPPNTRIAARFQGKALTKSGFDMPFARNITLEVLCFGPWCGGAGSDETYLAFLKREETGYVMEADPCGGMLFQSPTEHMLDQVERCFTGGRCGN